jgi:thiamine biosynthesis protein ThiS
LANLKNAIIAVTLLLTINGENKTIPKDQLSLDGLFDFLSIKKSGRLVELNGELYKISEFTSVMLKSGDNVEIIQFLGGG